MRWPSWLGVHDIVGLAGLGLLAYGLWWMWPPLAFIVPGAVLVLLSLLAAWKQGRG